jgi:hypothetical protein
MVLKIDSAKNRADIARLAAANKAPKVSTVQYIRKRLNFGRGRHPPNSVEGRLDAVERNQQRHHQHDHADRGELAGVLGQFAQVGFHLARGGRHEVGEDVMAELVAPLLVHRERRQHAEHHHAQRHQRERGGERQRARHLEQTVVEKPTQHETQECVRTQRVADESGQPVQPAQQGVRGFHRGTG